MNKKITKKYIIPIILVIVALLFEFFLSNFKVFMQDNKGNIELIYEINDSCIENNSVDSYVKKLLIVYDSKEDKNITIDITYYNEFDKKNTTSYSVELNKDLNQYVLNIDKNIKKLKISEIDDIDIQSVQINNNYTYSIVRAISFSFLLLLIYFVIYNRKDIVNKLHILALLTILSMGSLMIVGVPALANMAPDEQIHVYNAYLNSSVGTQSFSDSYYYISSSPGHALPMSLETNKDLNEHLNSSEMTEASESPKSKFITYNQVPYLISGLGINFANIFNLPFTIGFFMGKFFNLLFYAIISFFAIKIAKVGKKIIFALVNIPTSIFLASHYSLDGIMISTLLFSTVVFLNMYHDKESKITKKDIALFLFPVLLASFAKAIYAVLLLLLFILPKEKFESKKQRNLFRIFIFIVFLLVSYTYVAPMLTGGMSGDARGGDTDFIGQITSILTHPIGFVQMCFNNIYKGIYNNLLDSRMFNFFAYLNSPDLTITMLLYILLLYIFITNGYEFKKVKGLDRFKICILVLIICALIYGAMYLTFTEVGNSIVEGVQSRYFLPLLLLILIIVLPRIRVIKNSENVEYSIISIAYICILFVSIYSTMISVYMT